MTTIDPTALLALADAATHFVVVQAMEGGPYRDDTNGEYVKGHIRNSPVGQGYTGSLSLSQMITADTVRALVAAYVERDALRAEVAAFTYWRDSMAAILPDEYREEGAAVEVGIEDAYGDGIEALAAVARMTGAEAEEAVAQALLGPLGWTTHRPDAERIAAAAVRAIAALGETP